MAALERNRDTLRVSNEVLHLTSSPNSGLGTQKCFALARGRQAYALTGHRRGVNSVAVSPDGKRIVSGSDDNLVKIWAVESGAEVGILE